MLKGNCRSRCTLSFIVRWYPPLLASGCLRDLVALPPEYKLHMRHTRLLTQMDYLMDGMRKDKLLTTRLRR